MKNGNEVSDMNIEHLKSIAMRDQVWADMAEHEDRLKAILERGIKYESDLFLLNGVIALVLGDFAFRREDIEEVELAN
jgi:hypothetical protein